MKIHTVLRPKSLKILSPILVIFAALLIGGWLWTRETPDPLPKPPPRLPTVRVDQARFSTHTMSISSQGFVEPVMSNHIRAPFSGKITAINPKLKSGAQFRKGEWLFKLDDIYYQTNLARARSGLAHAGLQLKQVQAAASQARNDWQRLGEGKPNELVLYTPQLQEAKALVEAAEAELKLATQTLKDTTVVAPYDCLITALEISFDQQVEPSEPLGTLCAIATARIRLPIREEEAMRLKENIWNGPLSYSIPVVLEAELNGVRQLWQAQIVRSEMVIDRTSRRVYLVAELERPYDRKEGAPLPFGLHVQAQIAGKKLDKLVQIPANALLENNMIAVLDMQNRVRLKTVQIIEVSDRFALISNGLKPGEMVCISQVPRVLVGKEVQVVTPSEVAEVIHE
ncbi:MAG: efflux RND transporter periplasmic adaptor subunit [Desulfobulbaceae bacterium]|nr:MAG: efflux RND transporter periplasmic adaptor subunit [Desulfobulbaceae bacterium]